MAGLRRYFYDAASPECDIGSSALKPAAMFEVRTGISGIAAQYAFPERALEGQTGNTPTFYESYLSQTYAAAVFACYKPPRQCNFNIIKIADLAPDTMAALRWDWHELVALNPELGAVTVDEGEPRELFDALAGAACLLNPDDISFFLEKRRITKNLATSALCLDDPAYRAPYDDICKITGLETISWVPAPSTLCRMKDSLAGPKIT